MSYVLREYQTEAVARGLAFLRDGSLDHGLLVEPTGAGKSLIIAALCRELNAPTIVLQPTKEILSQNATKLIAYGFDPAIYSASFNRKEVGHITLATIGSVVKTPEIFEGIRYVIVDEAHLVGAARERESDEPVGMYGKFFAALGDVRMLGVTATPYRLSSDGYGGSMLKFLTRTRPKIFSTVVHYTQIKTLVEQQYLQAPLVQAVPGFDRHMLQFNKQGSDYEDDSVKREYNRIGFADRLRRVALRLKERGDRHHVVFFTRFIEDSEALAEAVPGIVVLHSKMKDKERDAIVAAFRSGEIWGIANVGILGLGFDFPALDTVVMAAPTVSLAKYYQQAGRLMRPFAEKVPWLVDMVDQVGVFGKVEDLWLKPGGKTGKKWEVVNRATNRALTNTYFGQPNQFGKNRGKREWMRNGR